MHPAELDKFTRQIHAKFDFKVTYQDFRPFFNKNNKQKAILAMTGISYTPGDSRYNTGFSVSYIIVYPLRTGCFLDNRERPQL